MKQNNKLKSQRIELLEKCIVCQDRLLREAWLTLGNYADICHVKNDFLNEAGTRELMCRIIRECTRIML